MANILPGSDIDIDVVEQIQVGYKGDIVDFAGDYSGKFICLEGIEGVGKTTQINWIADFLRSKGKQVLITREPGGTPIGEKIRDELLKHNLPGEKLTDDVEMMLVFAARSQHVAHKILPALKEGVWVVCSRFFESTFAYQGGGRGIDSHRIESLRKWVLGDFAPDITFLLDLPVALSQKRVDSRGEIKDRFEVQKKDFFERVRQAYLRRSQIDDSMYIIDASVDIKKVQEQIEVVLTDLI